MECPYGNHLNHNETTIKVLYLMYYVQYGLWGSSKESVDIGNETLQFHHENQLVVCVIWLVLG